MFGSFLGAALATIALTAAPAAQPDGQWNDRYIKAPTALAAAPIGADGCRYQLSFRRDWVDSRYALSFQAEFRTSSGATVTRAVAAENGPELAYPERSITSGSRYSLGNGYALAPFQMNVCTVRGSGETLIGLRLKANLDGGYTYTNNYRSLRVVPGTAPVPSAAAITSTQKMAGNKLTVTWSPATGTDLAYRVMVNKPVYYGGDIEWAYAISTVDVTGTSTTVDLGTYRPELDRQIAVVPISAVRFAADSAAVQQRTVRP